MFFDVCGILPSWITMTGVISPVKAPDGPGPGLWTIRPDGPIGLTVRTVFGRRSGYLDQQFGLTYVLIGCSKAVGPTI